MILVDSLHINNSGGKILLDYLVSQLEEHKIAAFYLFDERCSDDFCDIPNNRKLFLKAGILSRYNFYKKNKNNFYKVFCFANTPPPIKLYKSEVFTYFHNTLLVSPPSIYSLSNKIKVGLQRYLLVLFKKNTDKWIVQTYFVKEILASSLKLKYSDCLIYPFFDLSQNDLILKKIKNSFCYISIGAEHKNHSRLLEAWQMLKNQNFKPELNLTVPLSNENLIIKINDLKKKGINIINHGLILKEDVDKLYGKSEFLIYPSLAESFGLPLIEAVNLKCKVLASDLAYVTAVIQPTAVFDPYSSTSIVNQVKNVLETNYAESRIIVKNNIDDIINLLK